MTEANRTTEGTEVTRATDSSQQSELAMKLASQMLTGQTVDIKPHIDFTSKLGFTYPDVEQILEVKDEEVVSILEFLVDEEILIRDFYDKILRCPRCHSMNLRPSTRCPRCSSANVVRGRVLEHLICKYIGIEEEYVSGGKYICPKCKIELHTIGSDYQSLGLLYKCHDCSEIFGSPAIKLYCLKCSSISEESEVIEVNVYSYRLNEEKRGWLEFELQPKVQLIGFLKQHGYEVEENAFLKGRSGAKHRIDILATRDEGILSHNIAIGVKVTGERIELDDVFGFDDKAYDIGIHNKILIVVPSLGNEAESFASQQRIKVLEVRDLETVLASGTAWTGEKANKEPFKFESKSQFIKYLEQHGYEVKENAEVKGKSGAMHNLDILATRDDGIITYRIAIGIEVNEKSVGLDNVFSFDDKTYDIGIQDKILIAIPGLTKEANQFAQRQRIKIFEAKELEPSSEQYSK